MNNEHDTFALQVKKVVDLCAAPGSWSQVLSRKLRPKSTDGKSTVSVKDVPYCTRRLVLMSARKILKLMGNNLRGARYMY